MTSRDFVYWLQGYMEITDPTTIEEKQVKAIRNHLNLVFKHDIDPSIDGGNPEVQAELQAIHDGDSGSADWNETENNNNSNSNNMILRC